MPSQDSNNTTTNSSGLIITLAILLALTLKTQITGWVMMIPEGVKTFAWLVLFFLGWLQVNWSLPGRWGHRAFGAVVKTVDRRLYTLARTCTDGRTTASGLMPGGFDGTPMVSPRRTSRGAGDPQSPVNVVVKLAFDLVDSAITIIGERLPRTHALPLTPPQTSAVPSRTSAFVGRASMAPIAPPSSPRACMVEPEPSWVVRKGFGLEGSRRPSAARVVAPAATPSRPTMREPSFAGHRGNLRLLQREPKVPVQPVQELSVDEFSAALDRTRREDLAARANLGLPLMQADVESAYIRHLPPHMGTGYSVRYAVAQLGPFTWLVDCPGWDLMTLDVRTATYTPFFRGVAGATSFAAAPQGSVAPAVVSSAVPGDSAGLSVVQDVGSSEPPHALVAPTLQKEPLGVHGPSQPWPQLAAPTVAVVPSAATPGDRREQQEGTQLALPAHVLPAPVAGPTGSSMPPVFQFGNSMATAPTTPPSSDVPTVLPGAPVKQARAPVPAPARRANPVPPPANAVSVIAPVVMKAPDSGPSPLEPAPNNPLLRGKQTEQGSKNALGEWLEDLLDTFKTINARQTSAILNGESQLWQERFEDLTVKLNWIRQWGTMGNRGDRWHQLRLQPIDLRRFRYPSRDWDAMRRNVARLAERSADQSPFIAAGLGAIEKFAEVFDLSADAVQ